MAQSKPEDHWKRLEKISGHRINSRTYFFMKFPKDSLEKRIVNCAVKTEFGHAKD